MKTRACVAVAAMAIALAGCATVTRGTTTEFKVSSEPSGAVVESSTGFHCPATPCSMKVPRKNEFDVTVSKPGYVSKTTHIRSVQAGAGTAGMAGNLVLGGLVGMAVDGSNGSMKDLTPNPLVVTLEPEAKPPEVAEVAKPPEVAKQTTPPEAVPVQAPEGAAASEGAPAAPAAATTTS